MPTLRGFRPVFVTLGILYVAMAGSALAHGVDMLRDFGVPADVVAQPVLADFFSFFYLHMAYVGGLTILFGLVTRERRAQQWVCGVFALANLGFGFRDLATSDSRFGNHLYRGDATLVFVILDVAYALAFAAVLVLGARAGRRMLAR